MYGAKITLAEPGGLPTTLGVDPQLDELFAENVVAKLWAVAERLLKEQDGIITKYPETVPQVGEDVGRYSLRDAEFWTCGFFPGSLYTILERSMKFPQYLTIPNEYRSSFQQQLLKLAQQWAEPLYAMSTRTDTHDMSFIIQPALRMDWELTGNHRSLEAVLTAAESLASRYDDKIKAIRSWDRATNKRYSFTDKDVDFLVIIDSMCNLDLLYYTAYHTSKKELADIATVHAQTVLKSLVRDDFSTFHLVNFNAKTGDIKEQLTNQGYQDWSTWSRGQAWGILGYAQTHVWTKDIAFLNAAVSLANYFLSQLEKATHPNPYVPLWDFDAPNETLVRDTSAGMIAANGLLILYQALRGRENSDRFLSAAIRIVRETVDLSLSQERGMFSPGESGEIVASSGGFDAILRNATANKHENSLRQYFDHGLVYADYYFLEFGNKLMRMGML